MKENDDYTASGNLRQLVSMGRKTQKTAFGELTVAKFVPQAGWMFNYNINSAIVIKAEISGGTVTHDVSFAKIQSGTDAAGDASIRTIRAMTYSPGIGALCNITAIFDTPQEDSVQIIGIGNGTDGWFFGYNGLKFGVMKRRNSIDEWIYQENWSDDAPDRFNPQKGNVYQISYQWLGFGMQYFGIEDDSGDIVNVHKIKYVNLNINVSVLNPSLPITAQVKNSGNTTNIVLKTPSAVAGTHGDGDAPPFSILVGYELSKTIPSGETYLFSLSNPTTYEGITNRLYVTPMMLTLATEGVKPVSFRVLFLPVLTAPNWVDLEPGITPLQYDVSASAFSGGRIVTSFTLAKIDSLIVDLTILRARMDAGGTLAVVATSSGASEILVGATLRSRT